MNNSNKNPLYFDTGRTIFNLVCLVLLNLCAWIVVAVLIGVYLKEKAGTSTNADFNWSLQAALLILIPLNWFYWKTKVKDGKWKNLFYRTWK